MLKLYVKEGCAYSAVVRKKLDEEGIPYDEYNIANPEFEAQLMEKGGKHKTPFLLDDEHDVGLYQSSDIIDYLDEHYVNKSTS